MIQKATKQDIPRLLDIYATARAFMRRSGNPVQWSPNNPAESRLIQDIEQGILYTVKSKKDPRRICACFVLVWGEDPTYLRIHGGAWKDDSPYCAIHRVASDGTEKGVFFRCVEYAKSICPHLRIDTHRDNIPMQNAVQKAGFCYRGVIFLENGAQRLAYELTAQDVKKGD